MIRLHEKFRHNRGYIPDAIRSNLGIGESVDFYKHGRCDKDSHPGHDLEDRGNDRISCGICYEIIPANEPIINLGCMINSGFCLRCARAIASKHVEIIDSPTRVGEVKRLQDEREEFRLELSWANKQCDRYHDVPYYRSCPWLFDMSVGNGREGRLEQDAYTAAGLRLECCGRYGRYGRCVLTRNLVSCLTPALSKAFFLRVKWMSEPPDRRCCAFPDCGEFIPQECRYPPSVYGIEAPRRMYCLSCGRNSEVREKGE